MAQILKDEVRERIIDSAKDEFLQYSYEDSSMRRIALKSKMTVGNLYRYFSSKEEILSFIVNPTYTVINDLILRITGNHISILDENAEVHLTTEELSGMLKELADGLVDIYSSHPKEVSILMKGNRIHEALTDWFSKAITSLIKDNYPEYASFPALQLLARSYAISIFEGLKELLDNTNAEEEILKRLVKIYMLSYVNMLSNSNIQSLIEGGNL